MAKSRKDQFEEELKEFVKSLNNYVETSDGQWTIKGFIDVFKNIYTISSDTKIISKILEIHIFPKLLVFAEEKGYKIVLAKHQNYYPDISFVDSKDDKIKFAVDFKTTYRLQNPEFCNGFTLGSHGEYFEKRTSSKNIQFPYSEYLGHYCLGIIYSRGENTTIDETKKYNIDQLKSIVSVIKQIQFFVVEKWKIASDKSGSGNTANIGSINYIADILNGNGIFAKLGEKWFDEYWINYKKLSIIKNGKSVKIRRLKDYLTFKGEDLSQMVTIKTSKKKKKKKKTKKGSKKT